LHKKGKERELMMKTKMTVSLPLLLTYSIDSIHPLPYKWGALPLPPSLRGGVVLPLTTGEEDPSPPLLLLFPVLPLSTSAPTTTHPPATWGR